MVTEFTQDFLIFAISIVAIVAITFGRKFGTKMFSKNTNTEFSMYIDKDDKNEKR